MAHKVFRAYKYDLSGKSRPDETVFKETACKFRSAMNSTVCFEIFNVHLEYERVQSSIEIYQATYLFARTADFVHAELESLPAEIEKLC
jgi:hypothetical protein